MRPSAPVHVFARYLLSGVGLPLIWRGGQCQESDQGDPQWFQRPPETRPGALFGLDPYEVHLEDLQTRAGVLRQLAMWAGEVDDSQTYWLDEDRGAWLLKRPGEFLAAFYPPGMKSKGRVGLGWHNVPSLESVQGHEPIQALQAIVTHIGSDHTIRRSLLWNRKPGTLADFEWRESLNGWLLIDSPDPWGSRRSHLYSSEPHPDPTTVHNYTQVHDLPLDREEAWSRITRAAWRHHDPSD